MIRINLLPMRELRRQALLRRQLYMFCGMIAAVMMVVAFIWWQDMLAIGRLEVEKATLAAELERLRHIVEEVNSLESRARLLTARLETIHRLRQNQRGPVRVLDELSRNLPEQVWLEAIDEKGGVYRVSGYALTNFAVADLLRNLQRTKEFTAVDLLSSEQSVIASREIKKFAIEFQRVGGSGQTPAPSTTAERKPGA